MLTVVLALSAGAVVGRAGLAAIGRIPAGGFPPHARAHPPTVGSTGQIVSVRRRTRPGRRPVAGSPRAVGVPPQPGPVSVAMRKSPLVATKSPHVWPVKVPTSRPSCLSGAEGLGGDGDRCRSHSPITAQGTPLLSARKQLDIVTAYREVGTYRGAAEMCGVTHKTVSRVINRAEAAQVRAAGRRNYESVRPLVAARIEATKGKVSAKRLLPEAAGAGYEGSDRNFRRLVAQERSKYRQGQAQACGRRPAVWSPGEHLVIDWGVLNGLHVFCAVLAWSRVRFVRFADNERADTTLGMLAECFEILGGVPKVVLADRMGCLKGGVVADVVVPTPDYVRFATHYLLTELSGASSQVRLGVSRKELVSGWC